MKTKTLLFIPIGFTVVSSLFFLTSCSYTDKVVSSHLIQKRKYTKGYFVNDIFATKKNNRETVKLTAKNDEPEININNDVVLTADNNTTHEPERAGSDASQKKVITKYVTKISSARNIEITKIGSFSDFRKQPLPINKNSRRTGKIYRDIHLAIEIVATLICVYAVIMYLSTGFEIAISLGIFVAAGGGSVSGIDGLWVLVLTMNLLSLAYIYFYVKTFLY